MDHPRVVAAIAEPPDAVLSRRTLRWLVIGYAVAIIYGSFLPFYFNLDPNFVRWRWLSLLSAPVIPRVRQFFILDVASNVLLFVPLGFLLLAANREDRASGSFATPLLIGALGLLFGLSIECGQTLTPFRSPSILDALCNGSGAMLGAALGRFARRGLQPASTAILFRIFRRRLTLVVLGFLLLAPLADALYPFQLAHHLPTLWENLMRVPDSLPAQEAHRFWADLLFEKVFLFAAVGYLVLDNFRRFDDRRGAALAWLASSALALAIEAAKLLVVGRTISTRDLIGNSLGALLGVLVMPQWSASNFVQRHRQEVFLAVAVTVLCYFELTPFDWISAGELRQKIATIEWLPFESYYFFAPPLAIFDLGKKLFLSIPVGFLIAAQSPPAGRPNQLGRGAIGGTLIGLVLEAGQITLRSRTPALTDVILIGVGAWLGALAHEYFQLIRCPRAPARR